MVPIAQGQLAQTPFLHLVLYLHRQRLSGTLVLTHGERQIRILFREGYAGAARGLPSGCDLPSGMLALCNETEATYDFWDLDVLGEPSDAVTGSVDAFVLAGQSLSAHVRDSVVSVVVDRYRGMELRAETDASPQRFGLEGEPARLIEALRVQAMTTDAMQAISSLSGEQVRRVVYLLLITRMAAPVEESKSSSSGVRPASNPPPAQVAPQQPPVGAITVPSSQPPRTTRSSRPDFASVNPPAARPSTTPRPTSAGSQSNMPAMAIPAMPAWQQLASMRPGGAIPTPSMRPPAPTPRPMPSVPPPPGAAHESAGKLKRAEMLSERRNFDEAKRIVDEVLASDKKSADAYALRAWLLYQTSSSEPPTQELLQAIEGALRLNEAQPQALYVKALVLRKIGREPAALRHFKLALDADPRHVEAARELRLAKMRRDR